MNTRERGITIATVGYMFVAISGWMLFMSPAGWYTHTLGASFLAPLAIVLAIIAILSFVCERALDGIVFFGAAGVLGSVFAYEGMIVSTHVVQPLSYVGWFACMWFIYYLSTWLGSFRSGALRMSFLLSLWLALGCLAIGGWVAGTGWLMAGGYLGLIASALAFAAAANEIIKKGMRANPNMEFPATPPVLPEAGANPAGTARPMAAD